MVVSPNFKHLFLLYVFRKFVLSANFDLYDWQQLLKSLSLLKITSKVGTSYLKSLQKNYSCKYTLIQWQIHVKIKDFLIKKFTNLYNWTVWNFPETNGKVLLAPIILLANQPLKL